jgi:hypothetical protein
VTRSIVSSGGYTVDAACAGTIASDGPGPEYHHSKLDPSFRSNDYGPHRLLKDPTYNAELAELAEHS